MTQPMIITGADGQVGRALCEEAKRREIPYVALTRKNFNLMETESLAPKLDQHNPKAIINAAAYTKVDQAEEEEPKANLINGQAPGIMAAYCRKKEIPFIHYSTDYVFNGEGGNRPWQESDPTAPLNAYGRTKLAGEDQIAKYGEKFLIFRTSWVYDAYGKNFVRTMLRLGESHETLKVVDDQWGAPSYAPHIASATLDALHNAGQAAVFPSAIYHLCGAGETNWQNFAKQIFALAYKNSPNKLKVKEVVGIPAQEYPTPAQRPANSRLDCSKARQVLGVAMPDYEEALAECIALINAKEPVAV